MTKWTAPDIASIRGDNSRPLQKIFGSLTEYLKDYQNTLETESAESSQTFVRNGEATTLTIGTVVYLDAQQGDRATVKRAFNTSDATSAKTLGVVAETIPANADGLVTTLGYLYKCNTSAFTAGQTLYLGSTAGTFTATKPHAPNHMVYVGVVVRANAGNGIIYVRCQNGYELDEIHDVLITSPTTGDILMRNGSSLWVNTPQTSITSVGTLSALRVDGNFGIGASGLPQMGLWIGKAIGGSAFSQAIYMNGAIQPTVTNRADMIWTAPTVAASATVPTVNHFYATLSGVGTGSTVTTSAGFVAESNLGNPYSGTITNAYGFRGNLNTLAGFTRYNLFMNGSAPNYLGGRLGVGAALTSGAMAIVANTTAADKAFIVKGAAAQSGDFFDIQDSSGASQFKVDSVGNVGIGNSTPTSKLEVDGSVTIDSQTNVSAQFGTLGGLSNLLVGSVTGNTPFVGSQGAYALTFRTNAAERVRITSDGNVGIGTASPATKLDVNGTITATSYNGALASTTTATTQTVGDNSTKVATTAFVIANADAMSEIDAQTFSSSTTYTIPATSKLIIVECIGAGGGGGSGRRGGSQQGGGGGGGAWERLSIPVSELGGVGASVTVTIGAGGAGAPRATVDGNGSAGSKGGNSRFGTFYFSGAMGGGGGGSSGAGERGMGYVGGLAMTVGSEFGTGGRAALVARKGWRGGGGGGAGGYAGASSESDPPLTTTGQTYAATTGGGGAAGTGDGGNGTAGGTSQGGGGGANGASNTGGNGGNGGNAGGGGGGGGSSATLINSGAGGTGGNAQIKIWVFG
jgi:hypothetical protein